MTYTLDKDGTYKNVTDPPPPPPRPPSLAAYWTTVAVVLFAAFLLIAVTGCGTTGDAATRAPDRETTRDTARGQMIDWYQDHGTIIDDLLWEIEAVAAAADSYDMTAILSGCRDLGGVIDEAQALPPMPDTATNGHWQTALDAFGDAADACTSGDPDKAADFVTVGSRSIDSAVTALERFQ